MRKALCLLIGMVILGTIGCAASTNEPSYAEKVLGGTHELRKMVERQGSQTTTSSSFFLVVGSMTQTQTAETLIKFSWKMNDGTYAISSLPLEKIRVRIDETATSPTAQFRWRPWRGGCLCRTAIPELQTLMDNNVVYMLLNVRSADWPVQVSLPLNENKAEFIPSK